MIYYFILLLLVCTFSVLINLKIDLLSKKISIYDKPDKKRKLHKSKTPILGWLHTLIAMIFLLLFSFIDNENIVFKSNIFEIYNEEHIRAFISLFIGAFLIFFIGVYDDKNNISATKKSLYLVGILYLIVNFDKTLIINNIYFKDFNYIIYLENFAIPFTILSIFFLINSLNLYDGINLQTGLFLTFVFLTFILKGIFVEFFIVFLISNILFILKNFNGRLFYGDSGIYLNSYIISYFIIKSYNSINILNTELIMIIFFLPALDLLRVFIVRLLFLKNPFEGDRNHIHHILVYLFNNINLKVNLVLLLLFSSPYIFYEFLDISFIFSFLPALIFYFSLVIYFYRYKKRI